MKQDLIDIQNDSIETLLVDMSRMFKRRISFLKFKGEEYTRSRPGWVDAAALMSELIDIREEECRQSDQLIQLAKTLALLCMKGAKIEKRERDKATDPDLKAIHKQAYNELDYLFHTIYLFLEEAGVEIPEELTA